MSDKHTLGSWWVMKRTSRPLDDYYVLTGKDRKTGKPIDIASLNWLLESDEECRANADLIAAAPELFEVLENLLIETEGVPFRAIDCDQEVVDSLIERGHALIEKVKGEVED